MKEIWKNIPRYENCYQISNLGRIKGLKRYVKHPKSGFRMIKEQILKPNNNGNGYLFILLQKEGRKNRNRFYIHRLVYQVFNPNENIKNLCICHKDDNKQNNKLNNLFKGTQADNIQDMVNKNRQAKGEKFKDTKLTKKQVIEIRNKYNSSINTIKELSLKYNVGFTQIWRIVNRKQWTHI